MEHSKKMEHTEKISELLHEFVLPSIMVNFDFYCEVLRHWRENAGSRNQELWCNNTVPIHTSLKTTQLVTNNNMVTVPHPPYLTDFTLCDFALFLKLRKKEKGGHHESVRHRKGITSST
jgi:hypothetical protein